MRASQRCRCTGRLAASVCGLALDRPQGVSGHSAVHRMGAAATLAALPHPPEAAAVWLLILLSGAWPAALIAWFKFTTTALWAGAAVGAAVSLLTAWVLRSAAGKPALQALTVSVWLVSAVAAGFAGRCHPWFSAVAAVPIILAGKLPCPVGHVKAAALHA